MWFASHGLNVVGYDFAESAVAHANDRALAGGASAAFSTLDLYDGSAVEIVANEWGESKTKLAFFARFLVHSLEARGRMNLWTLVSKALHQGGGSVFLEFRTGKDEGQTHLFGDGHFRAFLEPDLVREEIEEHGGTVTSMDTGHGMAVYKNEDPHVARIVAKWPGRREPHPGA